MHCHRMNPLDPPSGSGNAMGGESFMIKTRKPADRSSTSMLIEPPEELFGESQSNTTNYRPWRYLKCVRPLCSVQTPCNSSCRQAIGENLDGYGTRMDGAWYFRRAYDTAKAMKEAQDAFCQRLEDGFLDDRQIFPESLETELLVHVLRGNVKVAVTFSVKPFLMLRHPTIRSTHMLMRQLTLMRCT